MPPIEKLTEYFREFPGIGPRQARRFVHFLLTKNKNYLDEVSTLIKEIKNDVNTCEQCFRFFSGKGPSLCKICSNSSRDSKEIMIVEKDVDLEAMEKSKAYSGYYFVLGGIIPILDKEPSKRVRLTELANIIEKRAEDGLEEITLAFSVNAEGEHTTEYLESFLRPLTEKYNLKITTLGRGLSTGSELEYADSETLKEAFRNRHS